jgi:tetratricopeptide (TPR) repeat protein
VTDSGPERRFFIAHSSHDKEFAEQLHTALAGEAWVDLYEIAVGQIILEEIAEGIESATDFVVLWSANSAQSRWMRFEFHMAFIRYLEDSAISIRILCLDDTPLRLYHRPFLQGRDIASAAEAALLLLGPAPRVPKVRTFVNRNEEIDMVERARNSSSVGQIWFCGFGGIGKSALVREAVARLVPDRTAPRTVEVRAGTGFVELDLFVTSLLGASPPPDTLSEREAEDRAIGAIQEYAATGGIWIFYEVQHWLEDDARPGSVLLAVLGALGRAPTVSADSLAIFTTTRQPQLEGATARTSVLERMRGLRPEYGVALLRAHGATADESRLRTAAEELGGHPLTLELAASHLERPEIDWEELRVRAANELLGEIKVSEDTHALLQRVAAVDGPLAAEDYADHLSLDDEALQRAVGEGVSYSLISEREGGFLQLHPLVRDYYMRAFRRVPTFQEHVSDLADRAKSLLETTPVGSVIYIEALVMTFKLLAWAMRLDEALAIRRNLYGTLMETAIELYHQRRYREAKRYFEIVIESTDDDLKAKLFLARVLAYLGEVDEARDLVDEILREHPKDHHAWQVRGRIEFIARDFRAAIAFYERANELRPDAPAVLRDLGQARMRIGDWDGARAALERAMDRSRDPDPWVLFQYCQVLEHFGEYREALAAVEQAIRRDPDDVAFHFRRGRIAETLGNTEIAAREYETCLRLNPKFVEALVSLASLCADRGDTGGARNYVERAAQVGHPPQRVLANVRAKIALADGDIDAARRAVKAALDEERELPSLDLAARVELEAVARGESKCVEVENRVKQYAEEMRVAGAPIEAERLLQSFNEVCG